MNNSKIQSTLLVALKKAGEIIMRANSEKKSIEKKTELSLVTATDKEAEAAILKILKAEFPDHSFLTEESPPSGNSPIRWIIDPIDGTTNFAHSYPVACVSIALEVQGELTWGGVYDPFRDELFLAEKGKGATLNGEPIRVSKAPSISESLIATGFPYDRRERLDQYLTILKDFLMEIQGIRRSGSAALDLCYVACGRLDGFWEFQLQPWDKAAAMLIIEEAGGTVTTFDGNHLEISHTQNVASNGLIHKDMLRILKPYRHLPR